MTRRGFLGTAAGAAAPAQTPGGKLRAGAADRKSVVVGNIVDIGGGRFI